MRIGGAIWLSAVGMQFFHQWKESLRGTPGHRFRDRYHQHQRSRNGRNWLRRLVRFVLAAVAFAIGVVLAFIPGPAILFFLIAGGLLATDWLWVARLLDWGEVKLRHAWQGARRVWQRLPVAGRFALLAAAAGLSAASTYGVYRLMD